MPNPLVAQGTLNRLRGSVVIPSFPSLNVTAPYLGREGIRLTLQGEIVTYIPTMTGAVTSPEPYINAEVTIHLLKSQALAGQYKAQMDTNAILGDVTVRSDSTTLPVFQIINSSIKGIRELTFAGDSADFAVMLGGYYLVNSALFA